MYGVLIAASAVVVLGLVTTSSENWIPFVLAFDAFITIALIVAVIAIAWKDPTRLMLGEVSATEYEAIKRLHLGDDLRGERRAQVIGASAIQETAMEDEQSPPPRPNENLALPLPDMTDEEAHE